MHNDDGDGVGWMGEWVGGWVYVARKRRAVYSLKPH